MVDSKTETSAIEKAFQNFTEERKDIAVVLINQHVRGSICSHSRRLRTTPSHLYTATKTRTQIAERIRHSVDSFAEAFPAVLEIPSKDHPYDPEKDSVLKRVRRLFGE